MCHRSRYPEETAKYSTRTERTASRTCARAAAARGLKLKKKYFMKVNLCISLSDFSTLTLLV